MPGISLYMKLTYKKKRKTSAAQQQVITAGFRTVKQQAAEPAACQENHRDASGHKIVQGHKGTAAAAKKAQYPLKEGHQPRLIGMLCHVGELVSRQCLSIGQG